MDHQTIWYSTDGAIATISLNRPERLNTTVPPMSEEIAAAVDTANLYSDIKVIVLPRKKRVSRYGNQGWGGESYS
ncbi:MAG: hypothetical protein QGI17_13525 [Arenicellales bacterium]|jgi:enoyl-CoA hydratase|nr:hypothetical protein [Arenicellales bacterium]